MLRIKQTHPGNPKINSASVLLKEKCLHEKTRKQTWTGKAALIVLPGPLTAVGHFSSIKNPHNRKNVLLKTLRYPPSSVRTNPQNPFKTTL